MFEQTVKTQIRVFVMELSKKPVLSKHLKGSHEVIALDKFLLNRG